MGLFDDEFDGEKQSVYGWMIPKETIHNLKEFLKFEDLCVGGFVNAFPNKVAYKWADVIAEEKRREAQQPL